jgi:hypothetical protein
MIDVINKLNDKLTKSQKARPNEGYVNGTFPLYEDCYPCMSDFSSRYWQQLWHKERGIEYFKLYDIWVSKQLFVSTTLSKNLGKIYFDLEYYSYIESIYIILDSAIENDTLIVELNNEIIYETSDIKDINYIDLNRILMLGEYLTIYFKSGTSGIIQIKYRVIG